MRILLIIKAFIYLNENITSYKGFYIQNRKYIVFLFFLLLIKSLFLLEFMSSTERMNIL